jgi:TPR repeat protein
MESNQYRSIVPLPSRELVAPPSCANRILGEMVESSLAVANVVIREAELDAVLKEARRLQEIRKSEKSPEVVRAFELFLQAAQAGHAEAQYEVSYCFSFGAGVGYDRVQADRWMRLAAAQGFAEAQSKIGNGLMNTGKPGEGVEWHRKAAEQGHPTSHMNLSDCYWAGKGVLQDYCQAYAWAQLAADAGDEETPINGSLWMGAEYCQEQATVIATLLPPKQLEKARELYLDCKRKYSAKR